MQMYPLPHFFIVFLINYQCTLAQNIKGFLQSLHIVTHDLVATCLNIILIIQTCCIRLKRESSGHRTEARLIHDGGFVPWMYYQGVFRPEPWTSDQIQTWSKIQFRQDNISQNLATKLTFRIFSSFMIQNSNN